MIALWNDNVIHSLPDTAQNVCRGALRTLSSIQDGAFYVNSYIIDAWKASQARVDLHFPGEIADLIYLF